MASYLFNSISTSLRNLFSPSRKVESKLTQNKENIVSNLESEKNGLPHTCRPNHACAVELEQFHDAVDFNLSSNHRSTGLSSQDRPITPSNHHHIQHVQSFTTDSHTSHFNDTERNFSLDSRSKRDFSPQNLNENGDHSQLFQSYTPQKNVMFDPDTEYFSKNPSIRQRGLFHKLQTHHPASTYDHVTDRGFPRNAEIPTASGVRSVHSPVHSTPYFEHKREFAEPPSTNHLNKCRREREPDKFDAKNAEWPDYLKHFEQVA